MQDTTVTALPWTPNRRRRRRGTSWVRGRFAGIPRSPLPRRKATRRRTKSSATYRGWRGTNKRLELTLPGGQQSLRWVYTRSGAGVATRRTGLRWQVLKWQVLPSENAALATVGGRGCTFYHIFPGGKITVQDQDETTHKTNSRPDTKAAPETKQRSTRSSNKKRGREYKTTKALLPLLLHMHTRAHLVSLGRAPS